MKDELIAETSLRRVWYPTRLLRPYRPLRDWATWRVAEIISPLSFRGCRVTQRRTTSGD